MKKTLILIINFYQSLISTTLKNILGVDRMCRFSPTCSEYAKNVIVKDGIIKGFQKSVVRLLRCQPFISF